MSVGVEETPGELFRDLECRGFSQEGDFRVRGDAFRAGEDLEGDNIPLDTNHLGQFSVYYGKLVVGDSLCVEGYRGLGDGGELGVNSLICFICHFLQVFY